MASHGINKVILIGRLGQDPELRRMQSGDAVANLSLATGESWVDKNTGEKQERTEWHRVVLWGKIAEVAEKYLHKGDQIYIEGQLRTRKWQDQSGQDRYSTEVVVSGLSGVMQMLGSPSGSKAAPADGPQGAQEPRGGRPAAGGGQGRPAAPPTQSGGSGAAGGAGGLPFDDSIPFCEYLGRLEYLA